MSDLISRKKLIDELNRRGCMYRADVDAVIREMPTFNEKHQLSEETPTNTPTNTPTDLISRAEVKRTIRDAWINKGHIPMEFDPFLAIAMDDINNIPSVSADRIGEWENVFVGVKDDTLRFRCNRCGSMSDGRTHYCANCGAKMK